MSELIAWLDLITSRARGKPVLLVEGETDRNFIRYFLNQIVPSRERNFFLYYAGGKNRVTRAIERHYPEWVGLIDRDEWSSQQVEQFVTHPRIKILPRFCLESFFCVPDELWEGIPSLPQKRPENFIQLKEEVAQNLSDWVAHGAMWRIIRKRRNELIYKSDFPALLDNEPVTDEDEIRDILKEWQRRLDPDEVITEYKEELAEVDNLSVEEQLKSYIHGKKFYRRIMVPALNRILGSNFSANGWLEQFRRPGGLPVPDDLRVLLEEILELFD